MQNSSASSDKILWHSYRQITTSTSTCIISSSALSLFTSHNSISHQHLLFSNTPYASRYLSYLTPHEKYLTASPAGALGTKFFWLAGLGTLFFFGLAWVGLRRQTLHLFACVGGVDFIYFLLLVL